MLRDLFCSLGFHAWFSDEKEEFEKYWVQRCYDCDAYVVNEHFTAEEAEKNFKGGL